MVKKIWGCVNVGQLITKILLALLIITWVILLGYSAYDMFNGKIGLVQLVPWILGILFIGASTKKGVEIMASQNKKPGNSGAGLYLGLGVIIMIMKLFVEANQPDFSDPFTTYLGYSCLAIGTFLLGRDMFFE